MSKNWPNDVRVGCKAHFNLLELIDCEIDLKELDEFEISFEQEELNEDLFQVFPLVMSFFVYSFGHFFFEKN